MGKLCFFGESLISTTYFSLLGKRARLFTKSRKGTTLHLKNGGLYLVLSFMMHYSLNKWNLVFCAAVKKQTYWILDYSFRCLMYTLLRKSYFVVFTNFKTATLCILHQNFVQPHQTVSSTNFFSGIAYYKLMETEHFLLSSNHNVF